MVRTKQNIKQKHLTLPEKKERQFGHKTSTVSPVSCILNTQISQTNGRAISYQQGIDLLHVAYTSISWKCQMVDLQTL